MERPTGTSERCVVRGTPETNQRPSDRPEGQTLNRRTEVNGTGAAAGRSAIGRGDRVSGAEVGAGGVQTGVKAGASDAGAERGRDAEPGRGAAERAGLVQRVRGEIARGIGAEAYARYFDESVAVRVEGGRLAIAVPTRFMASMIERRFGEAIRAAASGVEGMAGMVVEVSAPDDVSTRKRGMEEASGASSKEVAGGAGREARAWEPSGGGSGVRSASRARGRGAGRTGTRGGGRDGHGGDSEGRLVLSDRYRLEDFIVGESNRLAYDAATRLAESEPREDDRGGGASVGTGAAGGASMPLRARPLRSFGPLFIHGPCGMGKTHLLQGIAHRFKQRRPGAIVRFVTGEAFTNEFLSAIHSGDAGRGAGMNGGGSNGASGGGGAGPSASGGGGKAVRDSMERFRKRYRRVDLLCIDDIHFLASKSATQAELLHTFNELELGGAQIVLACDEHPRQVKKFSDALVSRFLSGMVARVDPPDRELCEKIVKRFAERRGLVFEQAALRMVSAHVAAVPTGLNRAKMGGREEAGSSRGLSIREIEGLVTRVEACVRVSEGGRPDGVVHVTTGVLRHVLPGGSGTGSMGIGGAGSSRALAGASGGVGTGGAYGDRSSGSVRGAYGASEIEGKPVRLEAIMGETCRMLGVEHSDLTGNGRHPRVVLARSIIGHLARRLTRMSFPEIARGMGRPSHSTIIAACQRLEKQMVEGDGTTAVVPGLELTIAEVCDRLAGSLVTRASSNVG